MNTAVVMHADSPMLLYQAGDINRLLADSAVGLSNIELWIFYQGKLPDVLPEFSFSLSKIVFLMVENPQSPESFLFLLEQIFKSRPVDLMVFTGNGLGAELATRLAFRLSGSSCLQVEHCRIRSDSVEVLKPAYGNTLTAKFNLKHPPYCLSPARHPGRFVRKIKYDDLAVEFVPLKQLHCYWLKKSVIIPERLENGLWNADFVLVVGQGVKSKENMILLKNIAAAMGAQLGASRPVVMNAWAQMNQLIGASGLVLSPKVCIAAGVSGAGVFSVGIKNSELLVAINTDCNAPVFKIADIGIVDDLFDVLVELKKIMVADKAKNTSRPINSAAIDHAEPPQKGI